MTGEVSYLIIESNDETHYGSVHSQSGTSGYQRGGDMAKLHARPSNQYRYEHYDPFF
jgi:hypothetical protein